MADVYSVMYITPKRVINQIKSAASFPFVPIWALTHASVHPFIRHFKFSHASAVLSAIVDLKSILSSDLSAA